MPPNVEEHVAEQIFRKRLIIDKAQQPAIDGDAVTREERPHRKLIACGDRLNQRLIARGFAENRLAARCGSQVKVGCRHKLSPAFTSRRRTQVLGRMFRPFQTHFSYRL